MAKKKDVTPSEKEQLTINAELNASEKKTDKKNSGKKKGKFKKAMSSRKTRHRIQAISISAIAVAVVVLVNVIAGLLVDRFPDLKADFTSNKAFELNDDTVEIMSHLKKNVSFHIVADEKTFLESGTYFVQAKNLLDKMEARSDGKFKYDFVDTTEDPNFAKKYENINWKTKETVGVIECGDQYKGLDIKDCFTYDESYYTYYQAYNWTGTTIEQAIAKGTLFVTSDERVIVDVMTGEGEGGYNSSTGEGNSGYDQLTKLLSDNAYQVSEVSLLTGELDKDAQFVLIFAPQVDISENAAEKLRTWLDNGGKKGKTLIYVPNATPYLKNMSTPNLDALLKDWGMELNKGFVFETNDDYRWNPNSVYTFLTDYCDKYTENLKNANVPVAANFATGIEITDANTAHALLNTSKGAGIYPNDAEKDFDIRSHVKGEPIAIAAEGTKAGSDAYSNVVVFSSSSMFSTEMMNYYSFNNGAYFMNIVNTIADKDDETVIIEGRTLQTPTLGKPTASTTNAILIIFVIAVPALILITGIVLWVRRRNK